MRTPRAVALSGIGAVVLAAVLVVLFAVVLRQPPSTNSGLAAGASTATTRTAATATGASNATSLR